MQIVQINYLQYIFNNTFFSLILFFWSILLANASRTLAAIIHNHMARSKLKYSEVPHPSQLYYQRNKLGEHPFLAKF